MINLKNFKRDLKTGAIINTNKEKSLEQRVVKLEQEIEELKLLIKGKSNGRDRIKIDWYNRSDER